MPVMRYNNIDEIPFVKANMLLKLHTWMLSMSIIVFMAIIALLQWYFTPANIVELWRQIVVAESKAFLECGYLWNNTLVYYIVSSQWSLVKCIQSISLPSLAKEEISMDIFVVTLQ